MRHDFRHRLRRHGRPAVLVDKNVDWPRGEPLANYTRTMNWDARTMKEEFDRKPGLNPASWKYGLGWMGGTPLQRNRVRVHGQRQLRLAHGRTGQRAVAAPPEDAERWQLEHVAQPARLSEGGA